MTLKVTPGNLRSEGPGFVPERDVKNFVNTTEVEDFGADNFNSTANNAIRFVTSQTDAPATNTRVRGLLWYKRGEGRLFVWDEGWNDSGASDSLGYFVPISDRKAIVARFKTPIPGGGAALDVPPFGLLTVNNQQTSVTNNAGVARAVPHVNWAFRRWPVVVTHQSNTTLAQADEVVTVFNELGYCNIAVHSNGSGPAHGMLDSTDGGGAGTLFKLTSGSSPYIATLNLQLCAHIVESGPASAALPAGTGHMLCFLKANAARSHRS